MALALISQGYSLLLGRFLYISHPFATNLSELPPISSFDLHVLGLPPAFVLSQDQTLKLKWCYPFP